MDSARHQRVSELFDAARGLPVEQREGYLRAECGDDEALLAEVRSLLTYHERGGEALAGPLVAGAPPRAKQVMPERVGRYRIIRKIGEGGMGAVYEAEQENPRRTVALKVIHAGVASSGMLRRFEHEAQILGRLQHPGIAQIFEAGTFDSGEGSQPFFAMELVNGLPLTEYAAKHALSTRQRLGLIASIGDAVQHAHQKGVIHRDLKPGNILVDAEGQPKILDFGVARVTDSDVQMTTMRTDVGQLIGTLPYMSPEQAAGDADGLDTRSDVYALGVVAYELLAGRLPHDLHRQMIHEAVRVIRDEEPTRLSSINRTFRGDIETIVGKALEKDRARRYQTASDLAEDIRRYLRDEAVVARPPSRMYQFRKFAKRNKAVVIGVAAVIVALLAGVIGTSLALVRAIDAERVAKDRLVQIEAEKARVELSKQKVEAVNRFQRDMLQSVDPRVAGTNRDVTVREVLDQAAKEIDAGSLKDQAEIEAAVRYILGCTYFSLGDYSTATTHLQRSVDLRTQVFGAEHLDVAESKSMLGETYRERGEIDKAEPLIREAMATTQALVTGDDARLADIMNNMALIEKARGRIDECIELNRQALAMRRRLRGDEHSDIMQSANNLAMALMAKRGDPKEIDALFQEGIDVGRKLYNGDHVHTSNLLQNQAELREATGDIPGALASMEEALRMRRAVLGDEHLWVAESMNNLAAMLKRKVDYAAAEPLYRQSMETRVRLLGEDHIVAAQSYNNLANLLQQLGKSKDAEPLLRKALEITRREQPGDSGLVATYMVNLALVLVDVGRLDEAETLTREALAMRERMGDASGLNYAIGLVNLASIVRERGADRVAEVESLQRKSLELMRAMNPPSPPRIAGTLNSLGATLREQGGEKLAESEAMLREALAIRREALGDNSPLTAISMHNLGLTLGELGRAEEAEALMREALAVRRANLPAGHADLAQSMTHLGTLLTKQGGADEAESMLREALAIRTQALAADSWRLAETRRALGACLAAQRKFDEAEPLLTQACEILAASPTVTDGRRREAFDSLIGMYDAWGRPEEAERWRARRDLAPPTTQP